MNHKHFIAYGMFLFCLLLNTNNYAATLLSAKIQYEKNATKIDFLLTSQVKYTLFTLDNPKRIVLDFKNTHFRRKINTIPNSSPIIKKMRTGYPYPGTFRIVIEVTQQVSANLIVLSKEPYKLRVNLLIPHKKNITLKIKKNKTVGLAQHALEDKYNKLDLGPTNTIESERVCNKADNHALCKGRGSRAKSIIAHKPVGNITIIIDAGHGGKDPGARGPNLTNEKDVVLEIAKKLKAIIDKEHGMRAILTRAQDTYVSLRKRLDIARQNNANLFISIHADAFKQSDLSGVSVYALSPSGATSEAAHWLAEKENYSELGAIHLNNLDDKNGLVREMLIDLSQTATIDASLHIGERVLKALDKVTVLHDERVEQARFVVLKSPDIPSILIETGFISNPKEEKKLVSKTYQNQFSQAVFKGIKQYFFEKSLLPAAP